MRNLTPYEDEKSADKKEKKAKKEKKQKKEKDQKKDNDGLKRSCRGEIAIV